MKRWLKGILTTIAILVLLLVLALLFVPGPIVATAVRKAGPRIMGVPVTLDSADVSLTRGRIVLNGLNVGNPEGFKTEHAFRLQRLLVKMEPGSLLSDKLRIENIDVSGPEVFYEFGLRGSNLGALQKQLASEEQPEETERTDKEPGTQVVIDRLAVREARLHLSGTILQGGSVPLALPPVKLEDIGKDKEGTSIADVLARVMGAVMKSAGNVAASSGKVAGAAIPDKRACPPSPEPRGWPRARPHRQWEP